MNDLGHEREEQKEEPDGGTDNVEFRKLERNHRGKAGRPSADEECKNRVKGRESGGQQGQTQGQAKEREMTTYLLDLGPPVVYAPIHTLREPGGRLMATAGTGEDPRDLNDCSTLPNTQRCPLPRIDMEYVFSAGAVGRHTKRNQKAMNRWRTECMFPLSHEHSGVELGCAYARGMKTYRVQMSIGFVRRLVQ